MIKYIKNFKINEVIKLQLTKKGRDKGYRYRCKEDIGLNFDWNLNEMINHLLFISF